MRKLEPIDDIALDFINKVTNSKHRRKNEKELKDEETIKGRRLAIFKKYKDSITHYDNKFAEDKFKDIIALLSRKSGQIDL